MISNRLHPQPNGLRTAPKQRGLGLLEVLLFIAVLSGLAVTGYLEWRARETEKTAREERQSLAQADTALITFATVNHRLPCPDTDRDGLENCDGSPQKGWLPSTTLLVAGADPGVSVGQMRYMVQRGATAYDLANPTIADDWRPLEYGGTPASFNAMRSTSGSDGYEADILTLADLCQRLEVGAGTTLVSGMAQVSSSPARAVAYAVVHPGMADADGNGSLFEGANALSTGNTVQDPAKAPLLSSYDDQVLVRSFDSLYTTFGCQPLFQSINTVALGLDVIDQVADMRADNIDAAERAVIFASLATAVTAVELTAGVLEAASDTGNAVADGVICGASLGLAVNACAAIGIHVGAAVSAGLATGASIATIALNAAAAVAAGNALALADSTADAADLTASCPTVDVSAALAIALTEWNDAKADQITLQNQLTAKQAELVPAVAARKAAYDSWLSAVRSGVGTSSSIDFRYTALYNAAIDWYTKGQTALGTEQQETLYATAVTSAVAQLADYDAQLADTASAAATLEAEIAVLDAAIAAETDPDAKEALELERLTAVGKLGLVNDAVALQTARDSAVDDLATAQANYAAAVAANTSAQSASTSAQSAYQTAYSSMNDATYGPYTIYSTNLGSVYYPSFVACTERTIATTACSPPAAVQVSTHASVASNVTNVYGYGSNNGSSQPQDDSLFLKPETIQKEIDALQVMVDDADERVVDTKGRYDDLLAQSNNPPACNITGTGVTPWEPTDAASLLSNVDAKGGTR